jgi:hypothetical protein
MTNAALGANIVVKLSPKVLPLPPRRSRRTSLANTMGIRFSARTV